MDENFIIISNIRVLRFSLCALRNCLRMHESLFSVTHLLQPVCIAPMLGVECDLCLGRKMIALKCFRFVNVNVILLSDLKMAFLQARCACHLCW